MIQSKLFNLLIITTILGSLLFTSCSQKLYPNTGKKAETTNKTALTKSASTENDELSLIKKAEKEASDEGKVILETGRKMALEDKLIIKGSCWNWINECFNKAGYGTNKYIAFKSKKSGPYVDQNKIEPGDWLYYINHSYNDVEHSGIFVYWIDYDKKIGMILSYGGESRNAPGRYLPYDLTHVYYITRAGKKK